MSVFDSAVKKISSTGATDDAAAAGALFTAAGIYQNTIDEIDDGDLGRLRASQRRALITVPDYVTYSVTTSIRNTSATSCFNLFSAASTLYAQELARYEWQFTIYNTHDQPLSVVLYTQSLAAAQGAPNTHNIIFAETALLALGANTGHMRITPYEYGSGTNGSNKTCKFLRGIHTNLYVYLQAGSSPTTGDVVVTIEGRTR